MGAYHTEEFTPEELAALGEAEGKSEATEEKGPDTQEAAETPAEEAKTEEKVEEAKAEETEQKPAEEAKAEEGTAEEQEEKLDPVQKRINKLTFEKNEERRKRELALTLGPERFFELYPEEKPKDWQPTPKAETKPVAQPAQPVPMPSLAQLGQMKVTGGQYDGYTLNEVASADPMAALAIRDNYLMGVQRAQQAEAARRERVNVESELNRFNESRSFEMYGKPVRQCSAAELATLEAETYKALDYLEKSGRLDMPLEHAYYAMRHDAKRKADDAAKAKLDKVTDGKTVKSISTATVPGVDVEWQGYLTKTEAQMGAIIDRMKAPEYAKFLKDAPKAVRDKFKSLPWD